MKKALLALTLLTTSLVAATPAHAGAEPYQPTYDSLAKHQVPQWFEDAKLGIFITWNASSVPAFAPKQGRPAGSPYAEWYWKELQQNQSGPTYAHHKETYGPGVVYDDFIERWKAEKFDPRSWLKLFKAGGAKYYTLVTKHHDGVALWDTATSDRNTVKMGPHRDIVKELVEANNREFGLKNGLYYSMPEWFHPNMPKIGGGWFGGTPPKNWLTGEDVPYTGYKPVGDYVKDHQYPQLKELVDRFDPDVIWCDIGLGDVNDSEHLNAYYFNKAAAEGKEVAVNNRCGSNVPADFTTPEYSVEPTIKKSKWEASRGIGRSYGYNAEELPADYLTADQLIDSFADIVSKNGNLLLNVGPKPDGTIEETQAQRVRELGAWLAINGEAMYGSRYWTQAEDKGANVPVRFTTQPKAFYATALDWPGDSLRLTAPIPVRDGDQVRLLGQRKPLKWTRDADGTITVDTSGIRDPGTHAYSFRFARPGYRADHATLLGVEAPPVNGRPGERVTVPVTLANRGDRATLPGLLTATGPDGRPVVAQVPALKPHTRTVVQVAYTVGGAPGDHELSLKVRLPGESFEQKAPLSVLGPMTAADLSAAYDNDGVAAAANTRDGDFDTAGSTYPAEELPAAGPWRSPQKLDFTWPSGADGARNNVVANGQPLAVPPGRYRKLHLLASAAFGRDGRTTVTVTYADGSTQDFPMAFADWLGSGATPVALSTRYRWLASGGRDTGAFVNVHTFAVDPGKEVRSVSVAKPTGFNARVNLHLWALTAEG
ncbi:alpha-L-fucosidase [Nonomuraea sp. NBC_01738]|uniref:alpha-L-fucosidase n=1 Tax=Nonomuraea sp. NBC_01738 TaxID=2976003 RepID=UPI002E0F190F|nr:alpha-L-fucosidase [Nonomuraea sp. NBC_01738]